jgi:hypothetical protein
LNDALLTALQTAAFLAVGGLALRFASPRGAVVARAVLAAGLGAAALMHVVQLVERGPIGASDQPLAFNLFWTSLALVDPLGALLLTLRPRAGILLTLAIMGADVTVNLVALGHRSVLSPESWRLWVQMAYAALALAVAPRIWAAAR